MLARKVGAQIWFQTEMTISGPCQFSQESDRQLDCTTELRFPWGMSRISPSQP